MLFGAPVVAGGATVVVLEVELDAVLGGVLVDVVEVLVVDEVEEVVVLVVVVVGPTPLVRLLTCVGINLLVVELSPSRPSPL